MTQAQISIENLSFSYDSTPILENCNLEFKKNGTYLIIGPNGGGKSTLLNLILSLLKPTTGTIKIEGQDSKNFRHRIGFVPQNISFDPLFPINIFEFVLMGALSKLTFFGNYKKQERNKALSLLKTMGILDLKNKSIAEVSGGQRQRALLARALMNDPDILIFDEATSHLDPTASQFIWDFLHDLNGKKTILMVSHEIPKSIDMIDQVICVQKHIEIIKKDKICEHFAMGVYH
jgi:zinc transport system ATP-binding protein